MVATTLDTHNYVISGRNKKQEIWKLHTMILNRIRHFKQPDCQKLISFVAF